MLVPLLLAALLASNGSGRTLVRTNPGTIVPIAGFSGPLILDDANTVAHVTWNGSALVDPYAVTTVWTQNGTVPQVARSGKTPAGAGPFSDANYYSLGTGSDVLDLATFTTCIVYGGTGVANSVMYSNGIAGSGPYVQTNGTVTAVTAAFPAGNASTANAPLAGLNVACFERSGTTGSVKLNLGTLASVAVTAGTVDATRAAMIGRYGNVGFAWGDVIYEVAHWNVAKSDAELIAIMQRVKLRAGITAW